MVVVIVHLAVAVFFRRSSHLQLPLDDDKSVLYSEYCRVYCIYNIYDYTNASFKIVSRKPVIQDGRMLFFCNCQRISL